MSRSWVIVQAMYVRIVPCLPIEKVNWMLPDDNNNKRRYGEPGPG